MSYDVDCVYPVATVLILTTFICDKIGCQHHYQKGRFLFYWPI